MNRAIFALVLLLAVAGCQKKQVVDGANVPDDFSAPPKNTDASILFPTDDLPQAEVPTRYRVFRFVYAGAVTDLAPGEKARVWIPIALTNHDQQVELGEIKLPGGLCPTS